MNNFKTPADFLKHIKASEALAYPGSTPSPEFLAIHREQERQHGREGLNPEVWLDNYFAEMLKLVGRAFPSSTEAEISQRIAIGCADNPDVNAFIIRSDDGQCFAILINRALITMINHYVKLIAAAGHPSSVAYCNGLAPEKLTRADYTKMSTQMLSSYASTGKPIGPQLKIAINSEAMSFVDTALKAMYVFLLGHEIGHYVNGDLKDDSHFTLCSWDGDASVFGKSVSHQMEFMADKVAFEVVLKSLASLQLDFSARRALDLSVTLFFNFVREISNRGSESHPKPSDRLLAIVKEFFGNPAARIMAKSFDDLAQIEVFREKIGSLTVKEVLSQRSSSL